MALGNIESNITSIRRFGKAKDTYYSFCLHAVLVHMQMAALSLRVVAINMFGQSPR